MAPLFAEIERFEAKLGLSPGFLEGLVKADDWSQVIKSHAVLEAALGTLVRHSLDERIQPLFDNLPFAGGRTTKLGMVEALDLLPESALQFLRWHSGIRNRLVHDVKHLDLDLSDYVSQMSEGEVNAVGRAIAKVSIDSEDPAWVDLARELLKSAPKQAAFAGVCGVLARCLFRLDEDAYEKARADARGASGPLLLLAVVTLLAMAWLRSSGDNETKSSAPPGEGELLHPPVVPPQPSLSQFSPPPPPPPPPRPHGRPPSSEPGSR